MNNSTRFIPSRSSSPDNTAELVLGAVNTILLILAFLENLLVIGVIVVKVPLKSRPINSMILSLSISDFLQSIFQQLPTVLLRFQKTWTMGSFVCKLNSVGRSVFTPTGLLVIALIGIERFRSLDKKDGTAFSVFTTRALILAVWVVCLGTALPVFAWFDVITYPGGYKRCGYMGDNAATGTIFAVVTLILFFLIPMVLTWFCYMAVIYRMMKSGRKVAEMQINKSANVKRQQMTIRVSRTCALIALVFTVCWTPFNIILLYATININKSATISMIAYAWPLAMAASCINPIIYGVTWKTLRDAIFNCYRCQKGTEASTTV